MKLAKHYLEQVAYADQLQTIAFVIFFVLFLIILFWILTGDKKTYHQKGFMPLQEDEFVTNIENNNKTE
ncbi:MAG: cbb3-type cytochrome c oxidase subunit 3 [Bacteroidales bacterium]|nr:cbb3-type cytochrome c oxidase subunit 3 [Bacteroidales bacterium]